MKKQWKKISIKIPYVISNTNKKYLGVLCIPSVNARFAVLFLMIFDGTFDGEFSQPLREIAR
jgi:hypothetical protein